MSNLVSYFSVKGLNGYKDISIDLTDTKPSILIAENGSSKTSFMKMLAYVLEGRYFSLNEFNFESLNIEFTDNKKNIHIKSKDLSKFVDSCKSSFDSIFRRVTSSGLSFDDYLIFLKDKYHNDDSFEELKDDTIIRKLFVSSPLSFEEIKKMLSRSKEIQEKITQKYQKNKKGFNPIILDACSKNEQIQYLPTYRRIESSYKDINYYNEEYPFSLSLIEDNEYNKMYFGLSDIHKTINSLLKEIEEKTLLAINQGLLNFIEGNNHNYKLTPDDLEYVKLAFLRVQNNKSISANVFETSDKQLSILFSNIANLLIDVKKIEDRLLGFIDSVNLFFSTSGDKKKLELDNKKLEFKILFIEDNKEISINIDNLSSGEKQILSMFASVYLSDKPKVLLIDEPEISLSLKWQRLLLPELVKAPFCKQLIAITHSPFIFDNILNEYAIPMNISNNLELFK